MVLWKSFANDIVIIWKQHRVANGFIILLSGVLLFYHRFYAELDILWTLQVLIIQWIAQYFMTFNALAQFVPNGKGLIAVTFRSIPISIVLSIQILVALITPMFLFFYIILH